MRCLAPAPPRSARNRGGCRAAAGRVRVDPRRRPLELQRSVMKNVMPFVPYVGASVLARAGATRVLVRLHFRTSVDARAYIIPSLGGRAIFRRIHELSNVSPLLVNLSQVLGTELLVHLKLLLCPVFLAGVNVSLPQPVMDI